MASILFNLILVDQVCNPSSLMTIYANILSSTSSGGLHYHWPHTPAVLALCLPHVSLFILLQNLVTSLHPELRTQYKATLAPVAVTMPGGQAQYRVSQKLSLSGVSDVVWCQCPVINIVTEQCHVSTNAENLTCS